MADVPSPVAQASPRRPLRRRLLRLLIVAVATYAGACVVLSFLQTRLIYFPTKGYPATPASVGLDHEEITLEAGDGIRLAAWYAAHPQARGTVIFCHGNAGNMSDRIDTLKLLHRAGYHVLMFDYRGYGLSEGRPSEAGTYLDVDAAWRHVVETRAEPPQRIVLFGRSLGGAIAIHQALRSAPAALVVDSTFTDLYDIGRQHYPLLPVGWLLTYRYASIEKVPRIHCPKLFVHATEDTLIPLDNGRRLFEAAAGPKRLLVTPGGHNSGGFDYSPEYTRQVIAFMDESVARGGS